VETGLRIWPRVRPTDRPRAGGDIAFDADRSFVSRHQRVLGRWHATTVHSYARENKPDVEALVRDLDALGYQTWVDSSLQGGQTWWEEILRRIGNCDVFVAIVSSHTLSSVACRRELGMGVDAEQAGAAACGGAAS